MAPTTTRKEDFLGRDLANATPGTTQAKDHLGRDVIAADKDFLGRGLTNPPWTLTTTYPVGARVYVAGGTLVATAITTGISGGTAPTAPGAVGGTVVVGGVTWTRVE
jgi:hypothetical protein